MVNGLKRSYTLKTPLLGGYQLYNAATAIGAVESLSHSNIEVSVKAIIRGLAEVSWPGRLEVMQENPLVVLDSAKDAEATRALSEAVDEFPHERLIAVISISSDKNIPEMIRHIASVADEFIITSHSVMGRAADRDSIGGEVTKYGLSWVSVEKVKEAVNTAIAKAGKEDMILVAGSVFIVGEARRLWKGTGRQQA